MIWQKKYFLLIVMCMSLNGCLVESEDELKQYIAEVQAKPGRPIPPIPEIQVYQSESYSQAEKRSPFEMEVKSNNQLEQIKQPETGVKPDLDRLPEPLEAFPLDSLRMVGILTKGPNTWALIVDKSGLIHRVTLGDHIGQNYGRITSITEKEIQLVEIISDGRGGWREVDASLAMVAE
jgi:type IV pilus assembly protein PilP